MILRRGGKLRILKVGLRGTNFRRMLGKKMKMQENNKIEMINIKIDLKCLTRTCKTDRMIIMLIRVQIEREFFKILKSKIY